MFVLRAGTFLPFKQSASIFCVAYMSHDVILPTSISMVQVDQSKRLGKYSKTHSRFTFFEEIALIDLSRYISLFYGPGSCWPDASTLWTSVQVNFQFLALAFYSRLHYLLIYATFNCVCIGFTRNLSYVYTVTVRRSMIFTK